MSITSAVQLKSKLLLTALLGAVILVGNVYAIEEGGDMIEGAYIPQKHTWEVGGQVSFLEYEEALLEEKGVMYGTTVSYTYRGEIVYPIEQAMLKLEGRADWGQLDFEGELLDGTFYSISSSQNFIWEIRGLIGYDYVVFTDAILTPYFGLGFRDLDDGLSKDPAGYERDLYFLYTPIGVEAIKPVFNGWSVGTGIEYQVMWYGKQRRHLGDAVEGLQPLSNEYEGGYGVRGAFKLIKENDQMTWLFEPFFRYFRIDESKTANAPIAGRIIRTGAEPKNQWFEYGLKVSALY